MCGQKRVWAKTCLSGHSHEGTIIYGHKRGGTVRMRRYLLTSDMIEIFLLKKKKNLLEKIKDRNRTENTINLMMV